SSAYTKPLWRPMNTLPPTAVGCDQAIDAEPGTAKAHFNFSWGTCSAVRPPCWADWNRQPVWESGFPPFHEDWVHGLINVRGLSQRFFIADAARSADPPKGLPVTNSAIARFSASLMPAALLAMDPVV